MGRPKKEKPLRNAERKKSWHEKNLVLIKRIYSKEKTIKKRIKLSESEIIAKINRKRKEKKIKGKSVDYAVKTEDSVSQMER